MDRALSLGQRGEEEFHRLNASHALERGRGIVMAVSDAPEARREARRRLGSTAPLAQIVPGPDIVDDVYAAARLARPGDERVPVAWVEAPLDAEADLQASWYEGLRALNRAREALGRAGPVLIVLAGPTALRPFLGRNAIDLASVLGPAGDLGTDLSPLAAASGAIEWLHLSDLHVRGGQWEQDGVLAALLRDLPGLLARSEVQPGAVFVTGDVAFSGQPREYEGAHRFLVALLDALGLKPDALCVVPGNHDVDRGAIPRMVRRDQQAVLDMEASQYKYEVNTSILGDPAEIGQYGARLANYCAFTDRLLGPARGVQPERPFRSDQLALGGVPVGVASLCSAWTCGPEEDQEGRIALGERQARELLDEIAGCPVRIALLHHPLHWLHRAERRVIEGLLRDRVHVVLHGHSHEADAEARLSHSRQLVVSAAGAAYVDGGPWRGFTAARLNPQEQALEQRFFAWSDSDGGHWHPRAGVQKGAEDGWVRLPVRVDVGGAATGEAAESLAARIARAAANVHAAARVLGVPARAGQRDASLADLFVPVDLTPRGGADPVKLADVARALLSGGDPPWRGVVLGDPGSGKTTLCRWLSVQAAAQHPPRAPLFFQLRDWLREGGGGAPLEFAAQEVTRRLSVPVKE